MDIYQFHPKTREFIRKTKAKLDPLETKKRGEDVYLLPSDATFEPPLDAGKNEVCILDKVTKEMKLVPDYRGVVYWSPDGSKHCITEIGLKPPDDALYEKPLPSQREIDIQKISQVIKDKIQQIAIQALKAEGKIDSDYEEPKIDDVSNISKTIITKGGE